MIKENRRISIVINGKEMIVPMDSESGKRDEPLEKGSKDGPFQWVLPETTKTNRIPNLKGYLSSKKKRKSYATSFPKKTKKRRLRKTGKRPFYLNKVWLSAMLAVLIGTSFGMMMLLMFTGGNVFMHDASGKGQAIEETADLGEVEVDLGLTMEVVQGGAYKTEASASNVIQTLTEEGFAAVMDNSGQPIYIYIGLRSTDEDAESLAKAYREKGHDTYVKSVSISPSGSMAEETSRWLSDGKQLLTMLVEEAAALFDGENQERNEIEKAFRHVSETYDDLNRNEKESLADFYESLSKANAALDNYRTKQNENGLWKAEQALLEAFLQYKKVLNVD